MILPGTGRGPAKPVEGRSANASARSSAGTQAATDDDIARSHALATLARFAGWYAVPATASHRLLCSRLLCAKARLIVEVDGAIHGVEARPIRDTARDRYLNENGYRVMRIGAADILRDAEAVAASIVSLAAAPSTTRLRRAVPPRAGEE
ncbi:hypothetical protein GCM10020258_14000 [Sphingomonas yabuuchiae]